jgi:hypothetical protein
MCVPERERYMCYKSVRAHNTAQLVVVLDVRRGSSPYAHGSNGYDIIRTSNPYSLPSVVGNRAALNQRIVLGSDL